MGSDAAPNLVTSGLRSLSYLVFECRNHTVDFTEISGVRTFVHSGVTSFAKVGERWLEFCCVEYTRILHDCHSAYRSLRASMHWEGKGPDPIACTVTSRTSLAEIDGKLKVTVD